MKSIIEFAKDKPVETSMRLSWVIVTAIDTGRDQSDDLADGSTFTVMWVDGDIQVATNGLSVVIDSTDALRLAADLRGIAFDGGACEVFHKKKTGSALEVDHILTFKGLPDENAEDQMRLSAALAEAVGTLESVTSEFVDELHFEVNWERGFIHLNIGSSTFPMTQPEALMQAARLCRAALDGGATVM